MDLFGLLFYTPGSHPMLCCKITPTPGPHPMLRRVETKAIFAGEAHAGLDQSTLDGVRGSAVFCNTTLDGVRGCRTVNHPKPQVLTTTENRMTTIASINNDFWRLWDDSSTPMTTIASINGDYGTTS